MNLALRTPLLPKKQKNPKKQKGGGACLSR